MLKNLKWVKKYLDEILTRNSLRVFPFSLSFRFEVYGNLYIERPLWVDNGNPLPICISEHIGKDQFHRKERSGSHCCFRRTGGWCRDWNRQQISQQLLGNCLQIACLGAAGCWGDGTMGCPLWFWQLPVFPKGWRGLLWPSLQQWIFQCLLPCSKSSLPKVASCLL